MFVSEKNVAIQWNMIITVVADDPLTGTGLQCVWHHNYSICIVISRASYTYSDTFSRCSMRMIQKFYPL